METGRVLEIFSGDRRTWYPLRVALTDEVNDGLPRLAFAARSLRKSPIFALTAAITIALGVGASTAIFSVANAVLLRPLPYHDPDRLVIISTDMRNRGVRDFPFSNANFIDLREGRKTPSAV